LFFCFSTHLTRFPFHLGVILSDATTSSHSFSALSPVSFYLSQCGKPRDARKNLDSLADSNQHFSTTIGNKITPITSNYET